MSLNNDSHKSPRKFVSPGSFFISFLLFARFLFGLFPNFFGKYFGERPVAKMVGQTTVLKRMITKFEFVPMKTAHCPTKSDAREGPEELLPRGSFLIVLSSGAWFGWDNYGPLKAVPDGVPEHRGEVG